LSGLEIAGIDSSVSNVNIVGAGHADAFTLYCIGTLLILDQSQCAIIDPIVSSESGVTANPLSVAFSGAFRSGSRAGYTSFGTLSP